MLGGYQRAGRRAGLRYGTCPCMSIRADEDTYAYNARQIPSEKIFSPLTLVVPALWPTFMLYLHPTSGLSSTELGTLPGTAAQQARLSKPVAVNVWCSLPIEIILPSRLTRDFSMLWPSDVL